jgi:hypothetical protein
MYTSVSFTPLPPLFIVLESHYLTISQLIYMYIYIYNRLASNKKKMHLERLRFLFPDQLPFFPRGWCLPDEHEEFDQVLKSNAQLRQGKRKTYIVKPSETSQGSGIFLVQTPEHLPSHFNERGSRNYVVQE